MNTTKKQHFIPEMLSKRFARPDGKFFFHDKRLDGQSDPAFDSEKHPAPTLSVFAGKCGWRTGLFP
ncbi:hypothetical protein ACVIHH_008016 [Bradyrhizobium sp. USDA 4518]